jgi:DNA-binding NarL/FixJ family response regulator
MDKYKVIIVDDHEIYRLGLKLLLNMMSTVNVVGEASNGQIFLELLETQKADIIFMDVNMPVLDGIDATEIALKKYPDLKIIALTTLEECKYFNKMIYAGAEGFMLKNSGFLDFQNAIEKIMKGGNYFSDEIIANFTKEVVAKKEKHEIPVFSKRELQVLGLICKGYSNEQIGKILFVSSRTVERYKTNLISKSKTNNTINLVLFAVKNKIIELE